MVGRGPAPHSPAYLDAVGHGSRAMLDAARSRAALEVDGGIARSTIGDCWRAGADAFVAGNAIFSAADPGAEIEALRGACGVSV